VLPVAKLSKDQLLGFLVSPLGIYREQVFFFFMEIINGQPFDK
jgi:hypothetical protein